SKKTVLPLAATLASAALLVWLALPMVWWTPLNVDEELTVRVSEFSFAHVFDIVSTKRGGGPLHFWLEHFLLGWWPGLGSLRIPSLVFICLALPAVVLIARRLVGDEASAGVVLLTAASPIPVLYATFGRPHTLLFAWLMWSTLLALKAAESGDRRLWAAAGAVLGLSVFVHPTAPLYAATALLAALLYAPRHPRAALRQAWPGLLTFTLTFVPYYLRTLHVLGDRYGVSAGSASGRTYTGLPVWQDARHFIAPSAHDVNYFTVLAAVGIVALLVQRRARVAAFCVVTVAAPIVFFSVVPASGDSALFFDRYMIPAIPAFLVLVMSGVVALARFAGPARLVVIAVAVGWLLAHELHYDLRHRDNARAIGVETIAQAVARQPAGSVLFGSTGTSGALFSSFDYGHPANLLDRYVALSVDSVQLVDDDSCARALPFLHAATTPRYGLWLFYAAFPDEERAAAAALARTGAMVIRPSPGSFLLRSPRRLAPEALIRLGRSYRLAWRAAVPSNRRVNELLIADRQLLRGRCIPYGDLGDPDISPHWPPVRTTHQ
ncbi:MAG TPA: glycosyltransferase family 39 protein, partial [Gaiellaceae bacterium]|nr:glycosyltransferase family 39 protein [Gaiellaceae bacterium]